MFTFVFVVSFVAHVVFLFSTAVSFAQGNHRQISLRLASPQ
jgi:hypothetical protein